MAYDSNDTIAAIASARGGGLRGIVRVSGPDTARCLQLPQERLKSATSACRIAVDWQLPQQRILPCEVYFWPDQRSYTRQPTAEIHMLGCDPLLDMVLEQICHRGARLAQPGEFTLRAFLAGRIDLTQAEAVLGVIDAQTKHQLATSLDQLAGGLSRPLDQIRNELLNLCADVEAGLDFVDEDIEFVTKQQIMAGLTGIHGQLVKLQNQIKSRSQPREMPTILLSGRPNVGKSTLWNRWSQQSALVSKVPGTTRDFLVTEIDLNGVHCRLIDTAGIDSSLATEIDQTSQRLSSKATASADFVVLCLDGSRAIEEWEVEQLQRRDFDLVIVNKVDCLVAAFLDSLRDNFQITETPFGWQASADSHSTALDIHAISAHRETGLTQLRARLHEHLQDLDPQHLKLCASTAFRCQACVDRAVAANERAQQATVDDLGQELLAAELRETLDALAEVVGEVYTDDILDRVFSRFCIGK